MNKIKEIYENALNISHDAALQAVYDAGYQDGAGNASRDAPQVWNQPEKQLQTDPKATPPIFPQPDVKPMLQPKPGFVTSTST